MAISQAVGGFESNPAGGEKQDNWGQEGLWVGLVLALGGQREEPALRNGVHQLPDFTAQGRKCLVLFPKPEDDVLQVVMLGLLPVTLSKVAVLPVLTEQVMLIPVPLSSASLPLISAASRCCLLLTQGSEVQPQDSEGFVPADPLGQDPAMSSS